MDVESACFSLKTADYFEDGSADCFSPPAQKVDLWDFVLMHEMMEEIADIEDPFPVAGRRESRRRLRACGWSTEKLTASGRIAMK